MLLVIRDILDALQVPNLVHLHRNLYSHSHMQDYLLHLLHLIPYLSNDIHALLLKLQLFLLIKILENELRKTINDALVRKILAANDLFIVLPLVEGLNHLPLHLHQGEVNISSIHADALSLKWLPILGDFIKYFINIIEPDGVAIHVRHRFVNEFVPDKEKDVVGADAGGLAEHQLHVLLVIDAEAATVIALVDHEDLATLLKLACQIHSLLKRPNF